MGIARSMAKKALERDAKKIPELERAHRYLTDECARLSAENRELKAEVARLTQQRLDQLKRYSVVLEGGQSLAIRADWR